jgi:transposase
MDNEDPRPDRRALQPITMLLTAGQAGDNPMLWPLLQHDRADNRTPFRLLADKAYSHPSTRTYLRTARIAHTIPERRDQIAQRKSKGSRGGRPRAFDPPPTAAATPSNAASTASNTGAVSPPATTNMP